MEQNQRQSYPKSPENIPDKLTKLPNTYHLKAGAAVFSVIFFFAFYIGLILGTAYLAQYAILYEMIEVNRLTILLKIGAIAGSVMLFIFTLKFIFKMKNPSINNRIKLKKEEHPEIWDFVYQICEETGAPKPRNIYVDPDVNAYVAYSNLWLSLFFPVKKELTIGLGLVSCLNLSEFKAVVSHEFGHFSQRSMTIGSYIITANRIIFDMIFSRDKWDDLLDRWKQLDLRISFAAYILMPLIWVIRQALNLFYQFLNIMHALLSREMEFNADKVAVSTSGSDAIVSGLWKLDYGYSSWNNTLNNAYLAAQKQMYIKNLYTHNTNRISELDNTIKNQMEQMPEDRRGGKLFFSSSENSKVNMYASHPENDQRESSAKSPYVTCETDYRSPWILFSNKTKIQEEISSLVYKQYWDKNPETFVEESVIEDFIREEQKEATIQKEYDNNFEQRFVNIPEEAVLKQVSLSSISHENLKEELTSLMKPIHDINEKLATAEAIYNGTSKLKEISHKGITYNKKKISNVYNILALEKNSMLNDSFVEWDKKFFAHFYSIAMSQDKTDNLLKLYTQQRLITEFYRKIMGTSNTINENLRILQQRTEVEQRDITNFKRNIRNWISELNDGLNVFDSSNFVSLSNIDNTEELKTALIGVDRIVMEKGDLFENGVFEKLMGDLENASSHCQRVEQKSIGAILSFHKELRFEV
jgi:Zn-dependent protease with chaperone function